MKTTTTLKTLTFAAATAMVFITPTVKAADWYVNSGTQIGSGRHTYDNIYIGSGGSTFFMLTGTASLQANNDALIGSFSSAGVYILDYAAFVAEYVTIGDMYEGYVYIDGIDGDLSQNTAHLTATYLNVGTGPYKYPAYGAIVVRNGAYFNTAELSIGNHGHVSVSDDSSATITDSLFIEAGGELRVEMGTLNISGTELRFGLSENGTGVILNDRGTVDFSSTTLAVVSSEIYAPSETFKIIEGISVPDDYWGAAVTASDTGQVFNIDYTSAAGNISLVATAQVIPEPSTYALLGGAGVVALAVLKRRRRKG